MTIFSAKRRPKEDFSRNKRGLLSILNFSFDDSNKFEKSKPNIGYTRIVINNVKNLKSLSLQE